MPVPDLASSEVALLFWNVRKIDVKHSIVRLVQGHGINVLILAEFESKNSEALLTALNEVPRLPGEGEFRILEPTEKPDSRTAMCRLQIFTRFPLDTWKLHIMHNRYAIWAVHVPHKRPFILAPTHLPAIQQDQGDQQREVAIALRQDIEEVELQLHEDNPLSIVIGDFNANPFDAGIAAVYGLNATHLKDIAVNGVRKANGRSHRYFFNPMWRFLGVEPWGIYFNNDDLKSPVRFEMRSPCPKRRMSMSNLSVPIPNFRQNVPAHKPPIEMLREAAQTLKQQTGGVVEGSVFTSNPGNTSMFRHTFYLRVRSLNDYTYPLFYVWHETDMYPAHLLEAGQPQKSELVCKDEFELRDRLANIFASPTTAQLVQALIAQADV